MDNIDNSTYRLIGDELAFSYSVSKDVDCDLQVHSLVQLCQRVSQIMGEYSVSDDAILGIVAIRDIQLPKTNIAASNLRN